MNIQHLQLDNDNLKNDFNQLNLINHATSTISSIESKTKSKQNHHLLYPINNNSFISADFIIVKQQHPLNNKTILLVLNFYLLTYYNFNYYNTFT